MCGVCGKSRRTAPARRTRVQQYAVNAICEHSQEDLVELRKLATDLSDIIVINSAMNTLVKNCGLYEQTIRELKLKLLP